MTTATLPSVDEKKLHKLCRSGKMAVIQELLSKGVSPDIQNRISGNTPLHVAATVNRPKVVQMLIKAGAQLDTQNNMGFTPLMEAIHAWSLPCVQILLEAGADIYLKQNQGIRKDRSPINAFELAILREQQTQGDRRNAIQIGTMVQVHHEQLELRKALKKTSQPLPLFKQTRL